MKREDIHVEDELWFSTIRNWVDHGGRLAVVVSEEPYFKAWDRVRGDTLRPATEEDPSSGVLVDIHHSDGEIKREVVSLFQLKGLWSDCLAKYEQRQLEMAAQRARNTDQRQFDALTLKRARNAGMTSVEQLGAGRMIISTDHLSSVVEKFEQQGWSVKT